MNRPALLIAAFAAGLLAGVGGAWLSQQAASGGRLATMLRSAPPAPPVFPARVVRGPGYDGAAGPFLASIETVLGKPLRERYHGLHHATAYRHRSLPQYWNGAERRDAGLIPELLADARRRGWTPVPDLALDLPALATVVAWEQGGYVFAVAALADTLAPGPNNPAASATGEAERWSCWDEAQQRNRETGKREPCDTPGFAPIHIWTNLPPAAQATNPWISPDAPDLGRNIWSNPPTWSEITTRR